LKDFGYLDEIETKRLQNVMQLYNIMNAWEKNEQKSKIYDNLQQKAIAFLNYLVLTFEDKSSSKEERIVLSNLHQAKGLEFEAVLFVYLDLGIIPSSKAMNDNGDEEARIFYVGITRAKTFLYLISTKKISPFVDDISSLKAIDVKSLYTYNY
jgi:DNA helicase-2/ATP-dependent DNA helicase PcrA